MSVVIALSDMRGHAVMASDGMTTRNGNICSLDAKKIYRAGEWLGGCAGVRYLYPMLVEAMDSAEESGLSDEDYPHYIAMSIKSTIDIQGWKEEEDPGYRPSYGVGFLLAHPIHGVWEIESSLWADLVTARCVSGYVAATGTGEDAALGAAHCMTAHGLQIVAQKAVKAACAIRSDCGGQVFIEESFTAADVETF